ncbi:lipid IV(A) 3-deoxy-D-manno-octulosonic acid transferase [Teredinibacter turnerae]|uniref:lipid IV(A) 3-deoxy-D-manno-octulosonic acid transferase n=1 Tax=Teredinibacter turnerae TaxID=2426 RepID=UPI0003749FFA|nr:lipid IV(A) 3-deoxy-D-manno-octulosonic acid transferase [Teredinibacter turnerae]
MIRQVYSAVFCAAIPAILARLWWRGRTLPAYRERWGERFAQFPAIKFDRPVIWVHTVSVGEFIAAKPMIDQLLARNTHELVVTTMTPTGSERVRASYGDRVFHVYAPYDIPALTDRFLAKTTPVLAIFLETELWPNLLNSCFKAGVPSVLANARLSEKSARGYRKTGALARTMLNQLTLAVIQNAADAERFKALGLAPEKAVVSGSIKFDITVDHALRERAATLKHLLSANGACKVWIAASTHKGEDEQILDAFQMLREKLPDHRLILVPRHPERFQDVYELCCSRGYRTLRRSACSDQAEVGDFDIFLGDTMGELMLLFGCANAAFVGGSFVANGGHNTIEPAAWGLPIVSGPSQFNFAAVSKLLADAGALQTATNASELSAALFGLLTTADGAERGRSAQAVAQENQGALACLLHKIEQFL